MAFRLVHTRNRQPKNNGSVNIARSSIDEILPAAIKQGTNALAVNALPIIYYRRKTHGTKCTCQGKAVPKFDTDAIPPGVTKIDEEGFGTDEYLNSLLYGSSFAVQRYGTRNIVTAEPDLHDNVTRSLPNSPLQQSKDIHNKGSSMDDPFVEELLAEDADEFVQGDVNIQPMTFTECPVCFGTGYVGGFDPYNAVRQVYDANADWQGIYSDDKTTAPASINCGNNIAIKVLLPMSVNSWQALRVWNGKVQVPCEFWIQENGQNISINRIQEFLGRPFQLMLLFTTSETTFTHFELQMGIDVNTIYAEWDKIGLAENLQVSDQINPVSITLSVNIPDINMWDVIAETLHKRLWVLTTVSKALDRVQQVHNWDAQARVIQPYELLWLLPRRYDPVYFATNQLTSLPDIKGEHIITTDYNNTSLLR